ncbi:hypothetical protein [Kutzneria kofuensis]|uniref:hypothetical protein n=1 Tax=Kutzneria kofuensis TaxID=103725 RepID=UPI0031EB43AC
MVEVVIATLRYIQRLWSSNRCWMPATKPATVVIAPQRGHGQEAVAQALAERGQDGHREGQDAGRDHAGEVVDPADLAVHARVVLPQPRPHLGPGQAHRDRAGEHVRGQDRVVPRISGRMLATVSDGSKVMNRPPP